MHRVTTQTMLRWLEAAEKMMASKLASANAANPGARHIEIVVSGRGGKGGGAHG